MKYLFYLSLVLLLACVVAMGNRNRAAVFQPDLEISLAQFSALGERISLIRRHEILHKMVMQRRMAEDILIHDLDSRSNRIQCDAAYLLGCFRMAGAVKALSHHIILVNAHRHPNFRLHIVTLAFSILPAVDALAKIGSPAIPEMLFNIQSSPSKPIRDLSTGVLIGIEGPSATIFRLQRFLPQIHSVSVRRRISDAIALTQGWRKRRKPLVSIEELLKENRNSLRH